MLLGWASSFAAHCKNSKCSDCVPSMVRQNSTPSPAASDVLFSSLQRASFLRLDEEYYAEVAAGRAAASGSTALAALVWGSQLVRFSTCARSSLGFNILQEPGMRQLSAEAQHHDMASSASQ